MMKLDKLIYEIGLSMARDYYLGSNPQVDLRFISMAYGIPITELSKLVNASYRDSVTNLSGADH